MYSIHFRDTAWSDKVTQWFIKRCHVGLPHSGIPHSVVRRKYANVPCAQQKQTAWLKNIKNLTSNIGCLLRYCAAYSSRNCHFGSLTSSIIRAIVRLHSATSQRQPFHKCHHENLKSRSLLDSSESSFNNKKKELERAIKGEFDDTGI